MRLLSLVGVSFVMSVNVMAADLYPDAQAKYRVERNNYESGALSIRAETNQKVADLQVLIDAYESEKAECPTLSCQKRLEENINGLKDDQARARDIGIQKTVQLTRIFVSNADALAVVAFMNEAITIMQSDPTISDVRIIRTPFPLPDGFDACARTGGRTSRLPSFMMGCREMTVEFLYQGRYYRTRLASGLMDIGYAHNGMEMNFDIVQAVDKKDVLFAQNSVEFMRNVTAGFLLFGAQTGRPNWYLNDSIYYWFGSESQVGTNRLF